MSRISQGDLELNSRRRSIVRSIWMKGAKMTAGSAADSRDRKLGGGMAQLDGFFRDYSDSLLKNWTEFVADFSRRARKVISDDEARTSGIRNHSSQAENSIRNEKNQRFSQIRQKRSNRENEIRRKYESNAKPSDSDPKPHTFFEVVKYQSVKDHWWKFGGGGLVSGWLLVNFDFGFLTGLAAIAGQIWWLQKKQHERIAGLQAALEHDRDQYALDRATAKRLREELAAECKREEDLASEFEVKSLEELSREVAAKTQEHHAEFANKKSILFAEWAKRCTAFNTDMTKMCARFDAIMAEGGARFASFDDGDAVHEAIEELDDQLSFRIGDSELFHPVRLEKELSLALGLVERPVSIERRFPVFYELGARKCLLINGGSQPASASRHRLFEVLMTRALRQLPAGKVTFTLIDPLGLGSNFAHFLKLQDFSDTLINGTVWTNRDQIKRRLRDAIEHIERVTQKYLRADYPDIESYNREAGEIAEPYRLICIADFPEAFDEEAVRDLTKIVQNGPRCGVHTVIYHNQSVKPAYGINLDELKPFCQVLSFDDSKAQLIGGTNPGTSGLVLDPEPKPAQMKRLVDSFGAGAIEAMKVEVPFSMLASLAKLKAQRWSECSASGITVPLGPSGAKKALSISFDSKLSHNALVVGRPGSGKSNMIHVFISMVCDCYSPDEVELYLVDFKKGVEFKDYANSLLPHARVIAVESEREFGISVLRALDKEMTVRSELFKKADAAENISEYRARQPDARMPRAVLIVDEFQEFFTKEDKIKSEAALLFDRIVRQGRSFGIHVMLGTQSLANSGLARSTIDQIPIRIALQCSDADSRLILADDNVTARGLSRPGEAIYNDKAGLIEGNRNFQVALFGGAERKAQLAKLMEHVAASGWQGDPPRIFEGHESASLATCKPILHFNEQPPTANLKVWVGEPVSLDDPVFCNLPAQAGRNMLVVSREEEQGTNIILAALTSLTAQLTAKNLRIHIVDLTTADAPWADFPEALRDNMPQDIDVYGRHGMRELLPLLRTLVKERQAAGEEHSDNRSFAGPRTVLAIIGAHRARELRLNDGGGNIFSFSQTPDETPPDLATCLKEIVIEGPDQGVNTLLWLDSIANYERILDRRTLGEFGIRISGALSEKDSHMLFDNQIAAQISHPNRMVKYDDDVVGVYELFRPYAVGSEALFRQLKESIFVTSHNRG